MTHHPVPILFADARRQAGVSLVALEQTMRSTGRVMSRQRISAAEAGTSQLDFGTWRALVLTLEQLGADPIRIAELEHAVAQSAQATHGPERLAGIGGRHAWQRRMLLEALPAARVWGRPLIEALAPLGLDLVGMHAEAVRRLRLGEQQPGAWAAHADDQVMVDPQQSNTTVRLPRITPFAAPVVLVNTGNIPWKDRLLVRLGPQVASSLPFTIGVLPVPDTVPGGTSTVVVPGRSHWFPNLAVVSFVMTFPDMTVCAGGRLCISVDTRDATTPDQTFPLPSGLLARIRRRLGG